MEEKYTLEYWDSFYKDNKEHIEVVYGVPVGEENLLFDDIDNAENVIISGTTGSGKSVFLHTFIKGAMKYHSPEDIKFVLVDTKRVEFFKYRNSEYLLYPIVKERNEFLSVINKLLEEIDNRKQNNIKSPCIALVIDEYADLVFDHREEIESSLTKLLKEGYKYGVHIFLSSQRIDFKHVMSKDLINLFKTRICQCSFNKKESIFLVGKYLEELKGRGDSLVLKDNALYRVQGLR